MSDYPYEKSDDYNGQNNPQTDRWVKEQFRHDGQDTCYALWVICGLERKVDALFRNGLIYFLASSLKIVKQ